MLPALLLAWFVVSIAVAALLAKLARQRRGAALPAEWRPRLERARVLAADAEITVVGRRLGAGRGGEVVLDCDGARTTLSLDELLGRRRAGLRPT